MPGVPGEPELTVLPTGRIHVPQAMPAALMPVMRLLRLCIGLRGCLRLSSRQTRVAGLVLLSGMLGLAGCGNFFHDTTTTTPPAGGGGGSTPSTVNYAFVGNTGSNTVAGVSISAAGMLTGLPGSPISLNVAPSAIAVSRNNNFLWVGTFSQIFGYAISPTGAITGLNSGAALANVNCIDMQTSPDGKWLMVLDAGLLTGAETIDLFAIGSNGTLTGSGAIQFVPAGTAVPKALRLNPAGTIVAAALGTAGEQIFSFNTGTGVFTQLGPNTQPPSLTSDNGIAWDSTGSYLYVARSGSGAGLVVTTVAASGALAPTTNTPYPAGSQPYSVAIDNTGKYAYVANRGGSNIYGYSIAANAALTALAGFPVASGTGVTQIAADSSGKWILAAAFGGTPDLSLYGFDTTAAGKLNLVSSLSTGGTNASLLALSH